MSDDRIEGFMVGGTTALTVASEGGAITLSLYRRPMERGIIKLTPETASGR